MIYFIMRFKYFSLICLVTISNNCRPPSHHSIWCILHFSPFLTKCTLLKMCLVWLVFLPFLAIQTSDLLSNIIRGGFYVTMSGPLFKKSWINIPKCAKSIPEVHAVLHSLYALDWATGPGTHVPGPVAQSSAESEYNAACTAGMALAHFRMLVH